MCRTSRAYNRERPLTDKPEGKNYILLALLMNVLTVSKKPNVDIATWASENSHVDLAQTA